MCANHLCWLLAVGMLMGCGSSREGAWETTSANGEVTAEMQAKLTELLEAAEAAWAQRDDEAQVAAAIENWKTIVSVMPKDAPTWTKLARAHYYHADCFLRWDEANEDAYKAQHEEGTKAAERALTALSPGFAAKMRSGTRIEEAITMLNKDAVPAIYWRSSNLGRWATIDSFATLLSYKDEIRALMQYSIDNDEEFFYKAPDRYFGVFFARAPGFAGGDMKKSRAHFEKSILAHPNYFGTRILMAEDYAVKEDDRTLFNDLTNYVLNSDPESVPEVAPENRCEQRKAKTLQVEADELF